MNVLVTGASGFIGSAFVQHLARADGIRVRAASRRQMNGTHPAAACIVIPDRAVDTDWRAAVTGIDVIVHLAGRAHVVRDRTVDPLAEFLRVNVEGTRALLRASIDAGVKRFVFVSSVKVNGEAGRFCETDPPAPIDPYGISKLEAERACFEAAGASRLEVTVIRPTLVYGPGARANFASLVEVIRKGIPLPFGAIDNRRSLLAIDNLLSLLTVCLSHPAAAGRVFLASDGDDLSTPQLVRAIAAALHRPARLIAVPPGLLHAGARLIGRGDLARRLLGSLQVDTSLARRELGWSPPVPVSEGLRRAVNPAP